MDPPRLISATRPPGEGLALERMVEQRLRERHESGGPMIPQRETVSMLSRSKAPLVPQARLARSRATAAASLVSTEQVRWSWAQQPIEQTQPAAPLHRDRVVSSQCDYNATQILATHGLSARRATCDDADPHQHHGRQASSRGVEMSYSTPLTSVVTPITRASQAAATGVSGCSGPAAVNAPCTAGDGSSHAGAAAAMPTSACTAGARVGRLPRDVLLSHSTPTIPAVHLTPCAPALGGRAEGAGGVHSAPSAGSTVPTLPAPEALLLGISEPSSAKGSGGFSRLRQAILARASSLRQRGLAPARGVPLTHAEVCKRNEEMVLPILPLLPRERNAQPAAAAAPQPPLWRRYASAAHLRLQRMVVHPHSWARLLWERFIALLVLVTVVEAPLFAAFLDDGTAATSVTTLLIDLLIGADVLANLLTGYVSDDANAVEMRLLPIALHYARGWLLLDLVAAWPVRLVALAVSAWPGSPYSFGTIVRVGRLARCLKVQLVLRTLRRGHNSTNSLMACVGLVYLLLMHYFTCLQWALPRAQGYPADSWPVVTGTIEEGVKRRYVQTAFNTISQMASIGYGNYQPETTQELITTVFNILMGNASFGLLVSAFAVKLSSTDSCTRAHDERLEAVNHYLALTAMPVELRQRVRAHMLAQFPSGKLYDEHQVLDMLPFQLRRDLNLVRARTLYQKVPLFRGAGAAFMVQVSQHLHPLHALPGEYLLHEGEPISHVSFIDEGAVEILIGPQLAHVAELHDGDFLGETACVRERVLAVTTARVVEHSVISSIKGSAFREILGRFPDAKLAVMHVINARLDVLERHRPSRRSLAHTARSLLHGGALKPPHAAAVKPKSSAPTAAPPASSSSS